MKPTLEFERPPSLRHEFRLADVERAHMLAVRKLAREEWSPIPNSTEVLTQLRRAGIAITQDELFRACELCTPPLPLADKPAEREVRARRSW